MCYVLDGLESIGCIVVDELHLLGDPSRGYLLELLLTKVRFMSWKYEVTLFKTNLCINQSYFTLETNPATFRSLECRQHFPTLSSWPLGWTRTCTRRTSDRYHWQKISKYDFN